MHHILTVGWRGLLGIVIGVAMWPATGWAQMGIGTTAPNAKAALDIAASDKGLLIPRLDSVHRAQISAPPQGLLVYQTDGRAGLWYYQGGWQWLQPGRTADNLGNHTATQNLNLGSYTLTGGGPAGLTVAPDGATTVPAQRITGLSGTGTRLVQTDAAGQLVAAPPVTVSNPQPVQVGTTNLALASVSIGVALRGNYAYLVNTAGNMLDVYDISNPAQPARVRQVPTGTFPQNVVVVGSYAYVFSTSPTKLETFDLSTPDNPAPVLPNVGLTTPGLLLAAAGQYLYVAGSTQLQTVSLANPAAPVAGATLTLGGRLTDLKLQGGYAYLTDNLNYALHTLSLINPAAPALVHTLALSAPPSSRLQYVRLAVQGSRAYATDANTSRLFTFDLSNPAAPTELNTLPTTGATGTAGGRGVAVAGTNVYVLIDNGLRYYDGSSALPQSVIYTPVGTQPLTIAVRGSYGYVSAQEGLAVIQLAGPAPLLIDPATGALTAQSLQLTGAAQGTQYTLGLAGGNSVTFTAADNLGNHTATQNLNLGANQLVGNGGSSGLSVSSAGNVGVGTTSPAQKLDVVGTTRTTGLQVTTGAAAGRVLTSDAGGNATWQAVADASATNELQTLSITGRAITLSGGGGTVSVPADNLGNHTATQNLDLGANRLVGNGGSAGLSITSGGLVGIGNTAPSFTLDLASGTNQAARLQSANTVGTWLSLVNTSTGGTGFQFISTGSANGEGAGKLLIWPGTGGSVTQYGLTMDGATGNVGLGMWTPSQKLDVGGNIRCVSLSQTSDARFKRDIRPVTHALGLVQRLRGVRYYWRTQEFAGRGFDDTEQVGFLAQELREVLPQAVVQDAQGYYSVDYSKVVPVLVEALKEQQAQLEALQKRLAALEGR